MIALTDLHSIQNSHVLWKELTNEDGLVSCVWLWTIVTSTILLTLQKQFYVPQEVHDSNFPCHIAVKDKDQKLLSYVISTYQTIKVLLYCDELQLELCQLIFQVSPVKLLTSYQTFTSKELSLHLLYEHESIAPQGMII